MEPSDEPYYRRDLALVHHLGFGSQADACAPGILALLEPVLAEGGTVLELGCGSGALTTHLLRAGHRVTATDASPAMLALAREQAPAADLRLLALPADPLPRADAVVSVGGVLNYLGDEAAFDQALVAAARALEPGGVLALDVCALEWAAASAKAPGRGRTGDGWAVVSETSVAAPGRIVRRIATFLRNDDGSWRRDDEIHANVLVDTERVPLLLAEHGVDAHVGRAFGEEALPVGMRTIVGRRR